MPIEPVIMAHSSDRMSPKRLETQQNVELGRIFNQLHGRIVDGYVRQRDVRVLLSDFTDDPRHKMEDCRTLALSMASYFMANALRAAISNAARYVQFRKR